MGNNFLGTTVILPATHVKETTTFYRDKLGFEVDFIWESPAYGSVRRGDVVIEFGEGRKTFAGCGVCFIRVANADAVYDEFRSKGIELVGDLGDRDYGSRDFRIKDNNGNTLIIGHALENQDALLKQGSVT